MIELVWEADCPNIDAARAVIRDALVASGRASRWGEWDVGDELTPADRRGYGSPSILVDGVDVVDAEPAGASCCRIYEQPDGELTGVPHQSTVAVRLAGARAAWRGFPRIETERLVIDMPTNARTVLAYHRRNREHLERWEPCRPDEFYTRKFWERMVAVQRADFLGDRAACFAATLREGKRIVAIANLRNFVRGAFQACHIGYSVDVEHEGQGLMVEMVAAVIDFAFTELRMHRVMANHLPENDRSARLLERLGFEREGEARAYLRIAGEWRDHVLNSKVNPDWVSL